MNHKILKTTVFFIVISWCLGLNLFAKEYNAEKLKEDLQIVWPLLQTVKIEYALVNAQLEFIGSESDKKEFLSEYEKFVKEKYFKSLLSIIYRQVKLLVLLIDRELGETPFNLLKQYRTFSRAVYWYRTAKVVGINIRDKYKAESYPEIEEELLRLKSNPPCIINELAAP